MCIDSKNFLSKIHQDLLCPICLGVLCINCVVVFIEETPNKL